MAMSHSQIRLDQSPDLKRQSELIVLMLATDTLTIKKQGILICYFSITFPCGNLEVGPVWHLLDNDLFLYIAHKLFVLELGQIEGFSLACFLKLRSWSAGNCTQLGHFSVGVGHFNPWLIKDNKVDNFVFFSSPYQSKSLTLGPSPAVKLCGSNWWIHPESFHLKDGWLILYFFFFPWLSSSAEFDGDSVDSRQSGTLCFYKQFIHVELLLLSRFHISFRKVTATLHPAKCAEKCGRANYLSNHENTLKHLPQQPTRTKDHISGFSVQFDCNSTVPPSITNFIIIKLFGPKSRHLSGWNI